MIPVAIAVLGAILAGSVYAIWRDHEEKKAASKAKFDRLMQAQSDSRERINWPPPSGPKGFNRKKAA